MAALGIAAAGLWEWWTRTAKKIGDFQARVVLVIFYGVIFAPFALAVRWASDPLAIKPRTQRGWLPRREGERTPVEQALRQF